MPEFKYLDKGQMATIGRNKAIMKAFGLELSGLLAWLALALYSHFVSNWVQESDVCPSSMVLVLLDIQKRG